MYHSVFHCGLLFYESVYFTAVADIFQCHFDMKSKALQKQTYLINILTAVGSNRSLWGHWTLSYEEAPARLRNVDGSAQETACA